MKIEEFDEDIKENKPKEGFLKQTSFLAMRTVYFFTPLTRWQGMFPCFTSDENREIVAPNDYLGGPKILELSRKKCGVQRLFFETRDFDK